MIAKSVIALVEGAETGPLAVFRAGLDFGVRNRRDGWGAGLTTLTCMMNLLPWLDAADRSRALYQGIASVAEDCAGNPVRFAVRPLPGAELTSPDFADGSANSSRCATPKAPSDALRARCARGRRRARSRR